MSVGGDLPPQCRVALRFTPSLGISEKKTLLAAQSSDGDIGLAFQGKDVSVVCHQQSGKVGDVFRQHLLAFDA